MCREIEITTLVGKRCSQSISGSSFWVCVSVKEAAIFGRNGFVKAELRGQRGEDWTLCSVSVSQWTYDNGRPHHLQEDSRS